jgi:hypothetical protein
MSRLSLSSSPSLPPSRQPVLALLLAAFVLLPGTAFAEDVDMLGTWFVLIHYRDSITANPDSDRWEDKVWKIEKSGSRLKWTEYPIVVFNDGSGRFGRVGRNPRARMLHKWEPNGAQMAEIQQGLQVNSRGSKTKSLRGSPKRGFKSTSSSRSTSAFTVGYQETWSVDDFASLPIFTRDDALGTESQLATKSDDVVSGRTRYKTLAVASGGDVLTGEYARDENKKGTFKLIRAGGPRGIESDGRSPNEKARDRNRDQFMAVEGGDMVYGQFLETLGDPEREALQSTLGDAKIRAIWDKYQSRVTAGDEQARKELDDELRREAEKAAQ